MAWAKNGTPDTKSSASQPLSISDLDAKKFNIFIAHTLNSGTTSGLEEKFNNNSNNVYALRRSNNGGADSTNTSLTALYISGGGIPTDEMFTVNYVCSLSGEEKLVIGFTVERDTAGASNDPERQEYVGKFVPSPDADITQVDMFDAGAGNYSIGSNLSAIGSD